MSGIQGIGIDVVDIARFEESLTRTPGLKARVFTPAEAERSIASLAARFAAKEALAKALNAKTVFNWQEASRDLKITALIQLQRCLRSLINFVLKF